MTLAYIIFSILFAFLIGTAFPNSWRLPLLMGVSVLAIYAFQPALPVRGLDFWLPTCTLAITTFTWIITTPRENRFWKDNWLALVIQAGIFLCLGLTRYLGLSLHLTASRPPQTWEIIIGFGMITVIAFLLSRIFSLSKIVLNCLFVVIILLFIILKTPHISELVSRGLRWINHQSVTLALPQDLRWLGFSYVAFRLLHSIRDRMNGRLPVVSLSEFIVYIIFFPSLGAGPIDRLERFIADLRQPYRVTSNNFAEAGKRIMTGLFKKFIIADTLAMVALNQTNALQVQNAGWAWVLLFAFSFQIFFDFSGYTDIAIGTGRLVGIKLPENFNSPYLKSNLSQFWNNWHITLTQWFRAYFFNPLTRFLRSQKKPLPTVLTNFICQVTTMLLIGLWHGVTVNFVLWGLWHGLGLFIHNRWSELTRPSFIHLSPRWQLVLKSGSVLLTFLFVSLGWIFFALPDLATSLRFLHTLFGMA